MLFTRSGVAPGATVLVQGAGGGVATALVALGSAAGYRMWVTGRDEAKRRARRRARRGPAFESGARLPERVDAVMETVGGATWSHSLRRAASRAAPSWCAARRAGTPRRRSCSRVFFLQLRVVGSTMGTRDELARLVQSVRRLGVRPRDRPGAAAGAGPRRVRAHGGGDVFGKVVFTRP